MRFNKCWATEQNRTIYFVAHNINTMRNLVSPQIDKQQATAKGPMSSSQAAA